VSFSFHHPVAFEGIGTVISRQDHPWSILEVSATEYQWGTKSFVETMNVVEFMTARREVHY